MKIGIWPAENVDMTVLSRINDGLVRIFPETTSLIFDERLPLSQEAFDKKRGQYRSNQVLSTIQRYAIDKKMDRVLGILNRDIFAERSLKEAIHEVGHTLGLRHCPRSSCVMHFSNSIFDTDKKQALLCDECSLQVAIAINAL